MWFVECCEVLLIKVIVVDFLGLLKVGFVIGCVGGICIVLVCGLIRNCVL